MPVPNRSRRPRRRRGRPGPRLRVEALEARDLPSAAPWPAALLPPREAEGNDTLDVAHVMGSLSVAGQAGAAGTIGNGPGGDADVDWYRFTLERPATVTLATLPEEGGRPLDGVLSLYNDATDVFDYYAFLGRRLVARSEGGSGDARLERLLAPGTYSVAVSGAGNTHFHPLIASSGASGSTGDYRLLVTATDFAIPAGAGPVVLGADVADGARLDRSPFVLRLAMSAGLDPATVAPGASVVLTYNPTGTFGDGNDRDVPLTATFSAAANELQLTPTSPLTFGQQPLAPGHYRLFLAGASGLHPLWLTDAAGIALGTDADSPAGEDYYLHFEITGVEGGAEADDRPATAHLLGDVTQAGLLQVEGAIGDDPAYDPANADPRLANPAADVDLYHFEVRGPGKHALIVEVAAGRVGSLLDAGVSLFRADTLELIAFNDSTLNRTSATDGYEYLYADSVLYVGLTEGSYYLAVSGAGNLPDPYHGVEPGTFGVFRPDHSHSGENGYSTGHYVLSLLVHPDGVAPRVQSASLPAGGVLGAPPTGFTVEFSEPVNLQQAAFLELLQGDQGELAPVFVRGADGVDYYPRLLEYDGTTNRATFLLLDRLPAGVNVLHLSGALGLTDLAGLALAGNDPADPAGDYVIAFTVADDSRPWRTQGANDSLAEAQPLGTLFPRELSVEVLVERDFTGDPGGAPADTEDFYAFEVLQQRDYFFGIPTSNGLPRGTVAELFTAAGDRVATTGDDVQHAPLHLMPPGTYVVRVGGWTADVAGDVRYQLRITLGGSLENPTPLTLGPAPAYRIRLASAPTPGAPPATPAPPGSPAPPTDAGGAPRLVLPPAPPAASPVVPADAAAPRLVLPPAGSPDRAAGIALAVLEGRPAGASSLAGLQPNTLTLLSDLPLGGTRSTPQSNSPPAVARLTLSGEDAEGEVRPADVEEDWPAGAADTSPLDQARRAIFAAPLRVVEGLRQWLLDGIFAGGDAEPLAQHLGWFWGPLTLPTPAPADGAPAGEAPADDGPEEAPADGDDAAAFFPTDLLWATGLLTAGGLVVADFVEPRRVRTAPARGLRGPRRPRP